MVSIDAHSHLLCTEWFDHLHGEFAAYIPTFKAESERLYFLQAESLPNLNLKHVPDTLWDIKKRKAAMDSLKIDIQVLSPVPNVFFYEYPADVSLNLTRAVNDGLSGVVNDNQDRFVGLCSVPLQEPSIAVKELERSIKTLGLKGVEIGSNINGMNLDDKSLWQFYEAAQNLDVPIMVHPNNVAGAIRLGKYHLTNLIGNPLDTTIAIASVIFGGVLEAFPRLRFFFVHGGGFIPYQIGRFDHGYEVRPEARTTSRMPGECAQLLYFDTILYSPQALEFLIRTHPSGRILLGSDCPFDMSDSDPVSRIARLEIDKDEIQKILCTNAMDFFRIKV